MYAKVDGVSITEDWQNNPVAGSPAFKDRPDMDRWILSYLQKLTEEVTDALNEYDAQKGGKLIEEFIDILSNWYIRRNRRRFWKGEPDADKLGAYDTLFRSLMTVARLMAPYTPFISEQIFLALVGADSKEQSIHLAGWPKADKKNLFDEKALKEGDLIQLIASLGRAARMQSGMKVRQPLSRIMIHVISKEDREAILKNSDVLTDELNVKKLEFLDDSAGILDYRIKPNLPILGKRLGSKLKVIQAFFKEADASSVAKLVREGKNVIIKDGSEIIELIPEEVILESVSKEGTSGVEGNGMLVALDTELTEDLIMEGYVRDLVRNVQELRKKSGLEITDRIRLMIKGGSDGFKKALKKYEDYINEETLAVLLTADSEKNAPKATPEGQMEITIDKEKADIILWKM
jgi:isoleucyl-tRNA synthetase